MVDRYELKTARTGRDGKTYWTRIGIMFPMKEKEGFNLILEALPIPSLSQTGALEVRISAWPPYEKDANGQAKQQPAQAEAPLPPADDGETLDDEIPF